MHIQGAPSHHGASCSGGSRCFPAVGVPRTSCQSCGRALHLTLPSLNRRRQPFAAKAISVAAAPLKAADAAPRESGGAAIHAEDKWIARTLTAFNGEHTAQPASGLSGLRTKCSAALQTMRMPSNRQEEFRFTDLSPILKANIQVLTDDMTEAAAAAAVGRHPVDEAAGCRVVVRNGVIDRSLSDLSALPDGVFVGSLADAPAEVSAQLGEQSAARGGPFAVLNGATATDVVCVAVPSRMQLERPIHLLHLTTSGREGGLNASAPRLLVVLGAGAVAEVLEEHAPAAGDASVYFSNSIAEIVLEDGAALTHGYLELEGNGASHIKTTLVRQGARSQYVLTEAALGAAFSRHDLGIEQAGEETMTEMRHFMLAADGQLHDLHSKLRLDHPGGQAMQLHKCIVSGSTGRGVFDGNVKVERAAQQTDAKQLSRNLLLVPRATVNVKPNLQIVADDVKCTHGCTVSDLEESQLFYFRSRGLDQQTARQMLVYSFGKEVTQKLRYAQAQARVAAAVTAALATTQLAKDSSVAHDEQDALQTAS